MTVAAGTERLASFRQANDMHVGRPRTTGKHSSRSHHVPTPDKISGCGDLQRLMRKMKSCLRTHMAEERSAPKGAALRPLLNIMLIIGTLREAGWKGARDSCCPVSLNLRQSQRN